MLPRALEIIFEVKMKMSNVKIARKKKLSNSKKVFFYFLLFGPFLFSKLQTFSFLIHFKQFKMLWECHLQFYNSSLNSNSIKATYKEFFLVIANQHCIFNGLFFCVLDPLY